MNPFFTARVFLYGVAAGFLVAPVLWFADCLLSHRLREIVWGDESRDCSCFRTARPPSPGFSTFSGPWHRRHPQVLDANASVSTYPETRPSD
jgi:hypothetical protein